MLTKDRDTLKEGRIGAEDKPATIHIDVSQDDTWTIDATHHIISPETGVVSVYEGPRSAGIDVQTHISRCVIDRRTSADTDASETVNDNEKPRVMTDGGQDVSKRNYIEPDVRPGVEPYEPVNEDTGLLANPTMWRVRLGPFPVGTDEDDPYDEYDPERDGRECGDPELMTDGGEPQSVAVVDARTPCEYRGDCPLTFEVTIGDEVTAGDRVGEVTDIDVRTSDTPHITVESGDFEATVKAGYWQCDVCGRLAVEDACGQVRVCQFCQGKRRQSVREEPETRDEAAQDMEVFR